jgi:hypothetical protein
VSAPGDVEIGLALVAAEVEHLEGAEGLAAGLQLALHLDEPLAGGVDAELAEVGGDPFAPELFGHGGGRAAPAEKVRHQIAFVAAGFDDALQVSPCACERFHVISFTKFDAPKISSNATRT